MGIWGWLSESECGGRRCSTLGGCNEYFHDLILSKASHNVRPDRSIYSRRLSFRLRGENNADLEVYEATIGISELWKGPLGKIDSLLNSEG